MPLAAVANVMHDFDCDSVVEALVREHLTKKQYNSTLAAFQQEQVGMQRLKPACNILHVMYNISYMAPECKIKRCSSIKPPPC